MLILIPNLLTALSLISGIISICLLMSGEGVLISCWIIFACAILDGLDGLLARSLNATSSFGRFFDSTADFVSFGLVPVFAGAMMAPDHGVLFLTASGVYLVSCLFRLIRFHRSSAQASSDFFVGLPVTAGACFFAAAVLIFQTRFTSFSLACLYFFLAFLMASRIPVPRLRF